MDLGYLVWVFLDVVFGFAVQFIVLIRNVGELLFKLGTLKAFFVDHVLAKP